MFVIIAVVDLWPPERRNLYQVTPKTDMGQAETAANQPRARKNLFDLLGCGVSCNIKILWYLTQQQVTHAATNYVGFKTILLQTTDNLCGMWAKLLDRNTMFRDWNNDVICNADFPKCCKLVRPTRLSG
jgi:hypothetical protein